MTDRPLRFCMITTFYPPYHFGGDGIFVHRLSHELARRGHHVEVVHCVDSYRLRERGEPAGVYEDHPNVTVHGLRSPWGFLSPLATHQTGSPHFKSSRLREILARGFDVIHYHNVSLVGGPRILEYGKGIKLYTMHEEWLVCPTHTLFKYNRAVCTRPHCLLCTIRYGRPPQWWRYSGLLRASVRHVDAFLAPSRFVIEAHRQRGLFAPMVHLPHFVPEAPEVPPPRDTASRPTDRPFFLFVGRLEKLKGLQTVIPLFRRYDKAELWIAGTGSYASRLRRMAAGIDRIRFLGSQSGPQLRALFRDAVALIVPSVCFDVFALVTLEAFQQKTPALVRNLGGMPEAVEESGGGVVFGTTQELAAAMDRLVGEPSYRDELGRNGYRAYRRMWTAEAHLERYFALIRRIGENAQHLPCRESQASGRVEPS